MLIPSSIDALYWSSTSLSRRVNANSQLFVADDVAELKLIKKGEC